MYERSAIVLERYFENLLEYRREGNLRDNFNNYCDLVEKLEKYQINYQKEVSATQEFNESLEKIKVIQASQEKLYRKSAKLEYNRNLLFNNIDAKVEETRRCIEKIEADVEKNNLAMIESKENLIDALEEYNEKRFELSKCKRYKKMAENAYNESLETTRKNYDEITNEVLNIAKTFSKFEDSTAIIEELESNGKDEKIPFNQEVIENATAFGIDIAKKEAAGYVVLYDKMTKLLSDIDDGATKIELHKKYARNEKAKMDFIYAAKNYMVQLLDYERMTIIHGRKSHNRLMSEACENFATDIVQINNLYELLLREIANKATKKAYKELYNKSYLKDIQDKEEKFKREKNRVNLNTATLINSNYWRIEGIKEIYTVYYKNVSEVFGKTVDEFDLPKEECEEDYQEENNEEDIQDNSTIEIKEKAKIPFELTSEYEVSSTEETNEIEENDIFETETDNVDISEDIEDNDYYDTYDDIIDNVVEEFQEGTLDEDFDIFGEKYRDIDFTETASIKKRKSIQEIEEDIEDEKIPYEFDEEDNLLVDVKTVKRQSKKKNEIEDIDITDEEPNPVTLIKKVRKISNVKKKKTEGEIW